jgi:RNA polymerase sigma-70 factor (ECF subfamily)
MTGVAATGPAKSVLERAIYGDEAAFERIVAEYNADLIRVAYGICGEADLALDAAQSAWIIAWRKLSSVRQPASLRSWLVAIAANEARHIVRRQRHVRELALDEPDHGAADPASGIARVDLVDALGRLKPEERALIAMRYGAELDSTEMGARLGISSDSVRGRLMRAMGHLRKELCDDRA